jgi:hypothetical protein
MVTQLKVQVTISIYTYTSATFITHAIEYSETSLNQTLRKPALPEYWPIF